MTSDITVHRAELEARILARAATLGGLEPGDVDHQSRLETIGLDSSDAVILAMEVEEMTGREIDVGIFLRFETIGEAIAELDRILPLPDPDPGA